MQAKFQNLFLLMKVATRLMTQYYPWKSNPQFQNLFLLMKVATGRCYLRGRRRIFCVSEPFPSNEGRYWWFDNSRINRSIVSEPFPSNEGRYLVTMNLNIFFATPNQFQNLFLLMKVATEYKNRARTRTRERIVSEPFPSNEGRYLLNQERSRF